MDKHKIEEFWYWFEENIEPYTTILKAYTYNKEEAEALVARLNKKVKICSSGLFIELGEKEMVITPHGVKEYFADAYELVQYAPKIDGWKIIATKPAQEEVASSEVTFMPLNADEYPEDIAIRLYHKDYVAEEGEEQNRVIAKLYALLDRLLGEESVAFDFQYIDFDDMPHPKEQDYPLSQLASFVEQKKKQRKVSGQQFPKENITLLEGKVEELPSLLVVNHALKYYEFTKEFPYLFRLTLNLKNIGENGLPTGNTDELYTVEDVIYNKIYKEQKGHFVATETYNGKRELFYYVDTEQSVKNALEELPENLESCDVNYDLSFDPFWVMTEAYRYM